MLLRKLRSTMSRHWMVPTLQREGLLLNLTAPCRISVEKGTGEPPRVSPGSHGAGVHPARQTPARRGDPPEPRGAGGDELRMVPQRRSLGFPHLGLCTMDIGTESDGEEGRRRRAAGTAQTTAIPGDAVRCFRSKDLSGKGGESDQDQEESVCMRRRRGGHQKRRGLDDGFQRRSDRT